MAISTNWDDREKDAFEQNILDEGTDKRVSVKNIPNVNFDSGNLNALGILRTSKSEIIFNRSERFNLEEDIYFTSTLASDATITHDADKCVRALTVTSTVGSKAVRQTRRYFRYIKGKPQYIFISSNPNGLVAGITKRFGHYDSDNGVFISLEGLTPKIILRSKTSGSVVDTEYPLSVWDDKLDGTGFSGITIDWSKNNLFIIDYAWLGAADIRFSVYHNGKPRVFHTIKTANTIETSWSQSAILPLRFEIENTASIIGSTLELSCYSIQTDDGEVVAGSIKNDSTGVTSLSVGTTEIVAFAIRLNTAFKGNIKPLVTQLFMPSGNSTIYFRVILNPVLTTAVWSDVPNSIAQRLVSVASFTGGYHLDSGYIAVGPTSTNQELLSDVELGRDLAGNGDTLAIVARTLSSNANLLISTSWRDDK